MAKKPEPPKSNARTIATYAVIVLLFTGAYYAGWYRKNHRYDSFAKCLASRQVRMYGAFWCPHCADQKALFGESFHYVPYTECAVSRSELTAECKAKSINLFPTWQFGSNPPKPGELTMSELSTQAGCSLP